MEVVLTHIYSESKPLTTTTMPNVFVNQQNKNQMRSEMHIYQQDTDRMKPVNPYSFICEESSTYKT